MNSNQGKKIGRQVGVQLLPTTFLSVFMVIMVALLTIFSVTVVTEACPARAPEVVRLSNDLVRKVEPGKNILEIDDPHLNLNLASSTENLRTTDAVSMPQNEVTIHTTTAAPIVVVMATEKTTEIESGWTTLMKLQAAHSKSDSTNKITNRPKETNSSRISPDIPQRVAGTGTGAENVCNFYCALPNCFLNVIYYKEKGCRRFVNSFYPNVGLPVFSEPGIESTVLQFVDCKPILLSSQLIKGGIYNHTAVDWLPDFAPQLKRKWFLRKQHSLDSWYRLADGEGFVSATLFSSVYALNSRCPQNIERGCHELANSQSWTEKVGGVGDGCQKWQRH